MATEACLAADAAALDARAGVPGAQRAEWRALALRAAALHACLIARDDSARLWRALAALALALAWQSGALFLALFTVGETLGAHERDAGLAVYRHARRRARVY